LLSLVVLPLLPEIVIVATSIHATAIGCQVTGNAACTIGPGSASGIIRTALEAGSLIGFGFGAGLAALWLALCYLSITQGWTHLSSRLLLAIVVSSIFAFLPYLAPLLSIGHLVNPNCHPNEGEIGPCVIYGGNVGSVAHETVRLTWRIIDGVPIALGALVLYVIVAIAVHRFSGKRASLPQQ
jgi:hypothetical protein